MMIHQYTDEDLICFANQAKEVVIAALVNEGLLEIQVPEDYEDLCATYAVMVVRRGTFGKLWDKVRGGIEDGVYRMTVVKSVLGPRQVEGANAPVIRLVPPKD